MKISKEALIKLFHLDSLLAFIYFGLDCGLFDHQCYFNRRRQERLTNWFEIKGIFWIVSLILIALIYKLRLDFLRNERLIILVILIEMVYCSWLVLLVFP